jgi:hypothetical protein
MNVLASRRKAQISSSQKLYTCMVRKCHSTNYQLLGKESIIGMEFGGELPDPGCGNPPED